MPTHSILIVGCGSIGERHLRCFQQTGRAAVMACDADPVLLEQIGKTYKVATVSNWEAGLGQPGLTAAVICTPAALHVSMSIRALAAGLHVLVEKPLSQALTGIDDLERTIRQGDREFAVAYVHRMFPFLAQAHEFIQRGTLGPIRQATVSTGHPFHRLRKGYAQTYYRDRNSGGGAIQDALTHFANWIESVLGPTDSVLCDCAHLVVPDVEVEDTVHVSARHGEVMVNYTLNQFQAPRETTIQFNAIHGSVKIEYHQQRWGVFGQDSDTWTWHDAPVANRDIHFTNQANAYLDQIEGKPARLCSFGAARQTLRFNLAALASAGQGARVYCRDDQPQAGTILKQ